MIDTYFIHVYNQPYSYFQEASFRQKLDSHLLPRCLVLAVLASAVKFSTHEYYAGRTKEATEKYARESWMSVLTDYMAAEENMNVHVVQTVNLLAVVDYTGMVVLAPWAMVIWANILCSWSCECGVAENRTRRTNIAGLALDEGAGYVVVIPGARGEAAHFLVGLSRRQAHFMRAITTTRHPR